MGSGTITAVVDFQCRYLFLAIIIIAALQGCHTFNRPSDLRSQALSAILSESRNTAIQISDRNIRDETLRQVAITLTITDDLSAADETAFHIHNHLLKEMTLADIAGITARSGDMAMAEKLAASLTDDTAQARAQSHIAVALAHSGQILEALHRAAKITNEGNRAFVSFEIVAQQAERGDWRGAESTAERIPEAYGTARGNEPEPFAPTKSRAFAYLVELHAKNNQLTEAVRLVQNITDIDEQGIALKHLVATFVHDKNYNQAVHLLASMPREGARTCGLVYLARHHAENGNIEDGLHVMRSITPHQKTVRCAHFPGKQLTLRPDTAQTFILMAAVKGGHTQEALARIDASPNNDERALARQAVAIAQAQAGDPAGGFATISNPSLQHADEALKEIALAYAKTSQQEHAFQTIQLIEEEELREDMQGQMVFELAKNGENSRALQTLNTLSERKHKTFAYIAIAESQAKKGQYNEALQTALAIINDRDRCTAIRAIAIIIAQGSNTQTALKWARELPELHLRAHGLLGVAKALLAPSPKLNLVEHLL